MIIVMSRSSFNKNIEELVLHQNYLILDGTDATVEDITTSSTRSRVSISTTYSNATNISAFSPRGNLYNTLLEFDNEDYVNEAEMDRLIDNYLQDTKFEQSVLTILSAFCIRDDKRDVLSSDRNVFLVLSDVVYKYLGLAIIRRVTQIINTKIAARYEDDYGRLSDVIYFDTPLIPFKVVQKNPKLLRMKLTNSTVSALNHRSVALKEKIAQSTGKYTRGNNTNGYKSKFVRRV